VRRAFLSVVTVAVLAALAPALARGDFKQPGGGVYCALQRLTPEALQCWRSRTGLTLVMQGRGRPSFDTLRRSRNFFEDSAPPLRIGHTWRFKRLFTCTMADKGLTCKNTAGHGWFMGRTDGYRVF
jgi:hypothetical protein